MSLSRPAERPKRILIFGGTGDANRIAEDLMHEFGRDVRLQLSLAGRTSAPSLPDGVPVRIGGFGGPEGIITHLKNEQIDLVIDATHPYATEISHNIAKASHAVAMPCIQYHRPAWEQTEDDNWIMVKSIEEAAKILPDVGNRALIASGAKNLHAFEGLEKTWLLVRTVDAPRDPFDLLERNEIDVIVSKNSGGDATFAKIEAARNLGIPVIMIERPGGEPVIQAPSRSEIIDTVRETLKKI